MVVERRAAPRDAARTRWSRRNRGDRDNGKKRARSHVNLQSVFAAILFDVRAVYRSMPRRVPRFAASSYRTMTRIAVAVRVARQRASAEAERRWPMSTDPGETSVSR